MYGVALPRLCCLDTVHLLLHESPSGANTRYSGCQNVMPVLLKRVLFNPPSAHTG
jgi:hypothetical protein